MTVLGILVLIALSFFAGVYWKGKTLGNAQKLEVKIPLEMQVSPDNRGTIPAGAILYKYRDLPEISTYYLFVNLKERDALAQYSEENKFNLVIPVTAYPKNE